MLIFKSAITLILLGVIAAVHIASIFVGGIISKILAVVNIGLHIGLFIVLMCEKIPIGEAVLCYMTSVFIYVASFFLSHTLSERRAERRAGK